MHPVLIEGFDRFNSFGDFPTHLAEGTAQNREAIVKLGGAMHAGGQSFRTQAQADSVL